MTTTTTLARRVALAACVLPLAAFAVLAYEVELRPRLSWDDTIRRALPTTAASGAIADLLVIVVPVFAFALCAWLYLRGRRRDAVFSALAIGGVLALDPLLKHLFHRPAIDSGGYSFPSGGAMVAMAVLAALLVTSPARLRPMVAAVGVPFVLGYGTLLVNLDWHYPTDVLAGWCLALAWVGAMWSVVTRGETATAPAR